MRVVTAEEMRELDYKAIHECGIPGAVLMENAAAAVVAAIETVIVCKGGMQGKHIAIFCGGGNNGGDGYAVARRLILRGALPSVYLLASEAQIKGDALIHFTALKSSGGEVRSFTRGMSGADLNPCDIVVDALLGTGLKDEPRELYADAIQAVNDLGRTVPVIAVDIPSGVNSDSGAVPGKAVKAIITVTFAYPKIGMYLFPGAGNVGDLRVDNIGFDWGRISTSIVTDCSLNTPDCFRPLFVPRPTNANKGDFGHVGIIAGSRGMAGAPALVGRSAQRAGAGLVTVFTPESMQPVVAAKLDEQMTAALPEVDGSLGLAAFDQIAAFSARASVICIGPGLTTHSETVQLAHRLLIELNVPIVLDADGLNALAMKPDVVAKRKLNTDAPLIITPHPGEAARLLGTSIPEIESNRIESVRKLAKRYGAIALLKGRYSLISDSDGRVWINTSGNPGMASGGMGDTLTGIIGGLLAQSMPRVDSSVDHQGDQKCRAARIAACAGAYVHGAAGDLAAQQLGEAGLTAGDVIHNLPAAMRAIQI